MGQKSQQAFNTMLAGLLAVMIAESFDTVLAAPGSRDAFVMAATVGLGGVISALLEFVRQVLVKWGTANGIDMTKVLGGIVTSLLVTIFVGCESVPTSSEGSVGEGGVNGKGGTYACAEGYTSQVLPDGSAIPGNCAKGLVWTDPPTPEESTGLVKVVEVIMAPIDKFVSALARLIPGG